MLPEHCRKVSIRKVNFELTSKNIVQKLLGTKIYKGTEFLILNNRNNWAIARIGKTPRRGLFWEVMSVDIISNPDSTIFIVDPGVDVLNKNSMVTFLEKYPNKSVVVQGKFEHVSFITPEPIIELTVLEVVPPEPPKVITLIKDLLKFRSFEKPIKVLEKVINIYDLIKKNDSQIIILPCHASKTTEDCRVRYLDDFPILDEKDRNNITLAGCDLSMRIFNEIYGFEPNFINICPTKFIKDIPEDKPVLLKCCKAKSFERTKNLYIVPWGVTYTDLEEAMNFLVSENNQKI